MGHGLFTEKVKLREEDHRYFNDKGDEFLSFSKFSNYLIPEFNSHFASKATAESQGITQQEVLDDWQKRTKNGTRIDKALEIYSNDGVIFSDNIDVADLIRSVDSEYKQYNSFHHQVVLFSEQYRVAGSCDKLFLFGPRKDSAFGISDFKVYEKPEDLYKFRNWCKEPFRHLPNCKFTKISWQLSAYASMFEQLTGRRCRELFIHVIDSVNKTHKKVHVPYLKNDLLILLEHNKEDILKRLMPESVF